MKCYRVRRETGELLAAYNKRAVGRGVRPPVAEYPDGTVDFELDDETVARLKQIDPDLDTAIAKLIWTARRVGEAAPE